MKHETTFDLTPHHAGFSTNGKDWIVSSGSDGKGTALTIARDDSGNLMGLVTIPGDKAMPFAAKIIEAFSSFIFARILVTDDFIRLFINDDMIAEFKTLQ